MYITCSAWKKKKKGMCILKQQETYQYAKAKVLTNTRVSRNTNLLGGKKIKELC